VVQFEQGSAFGVCCLSTFNAYFFQPPCLTFDTHIHQSLLFRRSALSSWILVISAPFYSLLILMAFVVVIQLLGSPTLVVGSVLLTLSPWTYVVFRKSFAWSTSAEEEKRVDWIQRGAGLSSLFGFILVVVWALSSGILDKYISYRVLATLVLRGIGNGLVTSIVFCDSFFRMAITNWKMEDTKRRALGTDNLDRLFSTIEVSIRKPQEDSFNVASAATASRSFRRSRRDSETHASEEDDVEKAMEKETESENVVSSRVDDDSQAPPPPTAPSASQPTKMVQRTITNKDGSKTVVEETVGPDGSILSSKKTTTAPTTEAAVSLDL
jgi:hypothetical protein